MKTDIQFEQLTSYRRRSREEMIERAAIFYHDMRRRRTVREFSTEPVPLSVIRDCIRTAATAPNGANQQPWHFAVIADANVKRKIRLAAEKEEREFYEHRATEEWLLALAPLGTDAQKPFLEIAPYLIAVFAQPYSLAADGSRVKHYYVQESVGIACGMLITALHHAGLATLTHTPSPMGFLSRILERPSNERPYLLVVTGYPADNAKVPGIQKKAFEEIVTYY